MPNVVAWPLTDLLCFFNFMMVQHLLALILI